MAAKKTSGARKYSGAASAKVAEAMHERKRGALRSGRSGRTVTSTKQAIAIGLSEARAEGKKVPKKRASARGATNAKTKTKTKRASATGATNAKTKRASATKKATNAKTKRASATKTATNAKTERASARGATNAKTKRASKSTGATKKRASARQATGAAKKRASASGAKKK